MTPIKDAAAEFLAHKRVAVTGVSRTPDTHASNTVYKRLRDRGYEVFAVNPNTDEVEGDPAYHDLRSIPGGVEAVVIGTSPEHAGETMEIRVCEPPHRLHLTSHAGEEVWLLELDLTHADGVTTLTFSQPGITSANVRARRRDSCKSMRANRPSASASGSNSTIKRPSRIASSLRSWRVSDGPEEAA